PSIRTPRDSGEFFARDLDESVTQGVAVVIHILVREPSTGGVENRVPDPAGAGENFATHLDMLVPQARGALIHTLFPLLSTSGVENGAGRGTSHMRDQFQDCMRPSRYGITPWNGRGSPSNTSGRKLRSPSHIGSSSRRSISTHSSVPSGLDCSGVPVQPSITNTKPSQSSPCLPKPGQLMVPRSCIEVHSMPASSRISRRMPASTSSSRSILPPRPLYLPSWWSSGRALRWIIRTFERSGEST